MLNVTCFLIFIVYSQWVRVDPFYQSQYPHLISIFLYIHIVGLVLESRRRLNFLQFSELTKQKKLVEDLSNQKSKIISILSHDIASPVHSLLGIINLEKKGQVSAEEIKPMMQNIGEELSRVHTLMFSLMRWSKSQIEGFNVSNPLFGVHDLILENINFLQHRIDTKNLRVQLSANDELWVRADLEMIRLVARNLLSNAVKFAPVNSTIQIVVSVKEQNVQIDIANEGAPISDEIQEQLFGFQIKSMPGTLNEKGSGLGLALAKYFTELNEGSLILLPYSETKLTTFRLILPLVPVPSEETTSIKRETEA
jgi:Signal transduction histidine kinase